MSKFAAIEARATQYPASTNDVVWLVNRVQQLRAALQECNGGPSFNDCFCGALDDNEHSNVCYCARAALAALDEPNLPAE